MIYSVEVIAFPASWKKRFLGILYGFLILQVANVLRIAALAYAGAHFMSLFEYAHIYVAQGLMVALALGIFFSYLHFAKSEFSVSQAPSAEGCRHLFCRVSDFPCSLDTGKRLLRLRNDVDRFQACSRTQIG